MHLIVKSTLELNFTKLIILVAVILTLVAQTIKIKYLNRYTTLKEQPLPDSDGFQLHPNIATAEEQGSGFSTYLDEFLSAIKVFGYLEKPLFHELARHLQTRRLLAGDTLSLETDPSFYIVIDGCMQVYVTNNTDLRPLDDEGDDEVPGLQLLNEVKNGGTLSSLFTILRLFTEDVKLRYEEEDAVEPDQDRRGSTVSDFDLDDPASTRSSPKEKKVRHSTSVSSMATVTAEPEHLTSPQPRKSSLHTASRRGSTRRKSARSSTSVGGEFLQDAIIARAKEDTTLAVLPAEAFRRLTNKFPNAAAHIVQVIITRLSRVTLLTSHRYLGLTKEIVRTEKAINELASYPLPPAFYELGGMQRLRRRFVPETSLPMDEDEEEGDYFSLNPPSPYYGPAMGASHRNASVLPEEGVRMRYNPTTPKPIARNLRSSSVLQMSEMLQKSASINPTSPKQLPKTHAMFNLRDSQPNTPFLQQSLPADFDLRASVMDCISKAMGLVPTSVSLPNSVENSPMIFAADSRQQPFSSSFASLSLLGNQQRDDESVVTSSSARGSHQPAELENEVQILFFNRGSTLVHEGQDRAGVFYVIDGHLDIWMSKATANRSDPTSEPGRSAQPAKKPDEARQLLFTVKPGGISGYLSALTGCASYVDITAKTDVYVGFLPAHALERLMDSKPIVLLTLAKRLISLLSPLILHIDLALEWMQVNAAQVIYKEGDRADSFYICIQGRLRAINEQENGAVKVRGEYGQGESIGELDCLGGSPRPTTLHAIRDTELVRMPGQLFAAIAIRHPSITVQMARILASRVRAEVQNKARNNSLDNARQNLNLKNVCVLPVSHHVPITDFANRLAGAFEIMGTPCKSLNQATINRVLGRHAFSRMGKLKLAGWLADAEQNSRIVLYVADTAVSSPWTQTCIRQADCILLVTYGAGSPELGEYESLLINIKTTARKELVLLHPERSVQAGSTRRFLRPRPWLTAHHHVQMPGAPMHAFLSAFSDPAPVVALRKMGKNVQDRIEKVAGLPKRQVQDARDTSHEDYGRLARWLSGKSVGLVLGGGGARGIAHVGTLQALQEYNIPIDMIGGTSIGAFVGGLYAREADLYTTHGRAKRFSGRMSTLWRLATDLTYPIVSYTTGHEFNRGIFKSFYDFHIEDFWLPFYAITTNITWSRMDIHRSGFAWRYIRASMSLAGLLPPLCDNGDMLLDGGYFDNLPVATMLAQGASSVFAVDVGAVDDTSPRNFGDSVSGFWVLFARWWPWSEARNVPSQTEIQARLTYVSSVKTLEEAKTTPGVFYMRQPVTNFGTMEFGRYKEIHDVGYQFASQCLAKWASKKQLPSFGSSDLASKSANGYRIGGSRMRRASI